MASGEKRVLLSPGSPSPQSASKKKADFPTPQRFRSLNKFNEPVTPACSNLPDLSSKSTGATKKRLSSPDEKPVRSRKKLFDPSESSHVAVSSSESLTSVKQTQSESSTPVVTCTPSCATPVEASLIDLNNTRGQEQLCSNVSPLDINCLNSKQNLTSIPLHYKNDTPLAEDELLLYALMLSSFPNDTFTKMHSTEKYDKIVQAIDNIIGVHYSSNSVRNYFHRVRNNQVKGIGKTKGTLRWTYFNNDIWNVMHSQGEVLQFLLKGNLLKENEKVSLLQQLHSTCVESISQKPKNDDNQRNGNDSF